MKKFLRRSGAALLAACTVWVVAATVESRSLPAAAEAMRESFQLPKALVQLELGDVLGASDLEGQTVQIEYYGELFRSALEQAKTYRDKHAGLYSSLGLLGGVFVVIFLI